MPRGRKAKPAEEDTHAVPSTRRELNKELDQLESQMRKTNAKTTALQAEYDEALKVEKAANEALHKAGNERAEAHKKLTQAQQEVAASNAIVQRRMNFVKEELKRVIDNNTPKTTVGNPYPPGTQLWADWERCYGRGY